MYRKTSPSPAIKLDYPWSEIFSGYKITVHNGYAIIRIGKNKKIKIHQMILGKIEGMDIDHINGDKLDNRISNLRHTTRSQSLANRGIFRKNKSGAKGIFKNKYGYNAALRFEGKLYQKYFSDFDSAKEWRINMEKKIHGKYRRELKTIADKIDKIGPNEQGIYTDKSLDRVEKLNNRFNEIIKYI